MQAFTTINVFFFFVGLYHTMQEELNSFHSNAGVQRCVLARDSKTQCGRVPDEIKKIGFFVLLWCAWQLIIAPQRNLLGRVFSRIYQTRRVARE